eukprot:RCo029093
MRSNHHLLASSSSLMLLARRQWHVSRHMDPPNCTSSGSFLFSPYSSSLSVLPTIKRFNGNQNAQERGRLASKTAAFRDFCDHFSSKPLPSSKCALRSIAVFSGDFWVSVNVVVNSSVTIWPHSPLCTGARNLPLNFGLHFFVHEI